jgi:putative FmdB family regulatory protein
MDNFMTNCLTGIDIFLVNIYIEANTFKEYEVMPIYEYQCDKCKKQFEVVTLSLSEKPKAGCPKCKSKNTSKMMSRVGKGKYSSMGSGSSAGSSSSSSSSCSSCSSSNCSSCGH